jgi:lipid-A-disaccharide synthase
VRVVVDQRQLGVIGLLAVVPHIPRIFGILSQLTAAARLEKPDVAILTDSAGFHLRVAKRLHALGIPVVQLIAPQAWAWREYRVKTMRKTLRQLLCILPFEEKFFRDRGVPTTYIGHPLARLARATLTREEFCAQLGIPVESRIVALLPGSRKGEVARHVPILLETVKKLGSGVVPILALPGGFGAQEANFLEPIRAAAIKLVEGHTWEILAHAELALAASGTVTIEAAMLGTPMVTFYRANALDWYLGRWLVKAPFLSMVNIVAGRKVVAELIQHDCTPDRIAAEGRRLLEDEGARRKMQTELANIVAQLRSDRDPMEKAADCIEQVWNHAR